MILASLAAFYTQVASAPGFVKAKVSYVVDLDGVGNLVGIRPLDPENNGLVMEVPEGPVRTVKPLAYFLADNAAYTLGAAMDPADAKSAKVEAAERRLAAADDYFALFRDKWRKEFIPAAQKVGGVPSSARALNAFLENHDPVRFRVSGMAGMAKTERFFESRITFAVQGRMLVEDEDIRRVLTDLLLADLAHETADICCVTGEFGPVAKTHAKLKGVPLSLSGQSSLISFNEASFRAYGLGSGADLTAAVSVRAMSAYTGALNYMLGAEGREHRRIIGDTAFLFWGTEDSFMEQVREVLLVEAPIEPSRKAKKAEQTAERVFASPFTGYVDVRDAGVNLLGLTAAQARAAISYWHAGSVADYSRSILGWVQHLADGAGFPWMSQLNDRPWRPTISRMTRLLGGEGSSEGVVRARGRIARALAACAFEGALVAPELVHIASRKALHGEWPGGSSNGDYACLMGLLAAYELRKRNTDMETLMIDNTYLLGRFYSLVEKAEIDSLQARGSKVSTAPVTRIKKGIYTRPRWGFQQLDDRFEVAVRRMRGPQQVYYRKLRTEVLGDLAAEKFATTSLDGNLFLIGAQHEARKLWSSKANAPQQAVA